MILRMHIYIYILVLCFGFCYPIHAQTATAPFNNEVSAYFVVNQLIAQKQDKAEIEIKENPPRIQKINNAKKRTTKIEQKQTNETSREVYERRGIVIAKNRIRINSQIDATVSKLHVAEGEQFKKNDLLMEFDCSIERASLEEARLSHEVVKFEYTAKKREAEEMPIPSETLELLKLKTDLALTKLNHLRERIKYCRLFSPFAGRALKILVQEHETADALAPVMEIIDDQALYFRTFLPWSWLKWLSVGDTVEVEVMNKNYLAELAELSEEVDPLDQSIRAILKFQSQDVLMIGMNGVVKFKNIEYETNQEIKQ